MSAAVLPMDVALDEFVPPPDLRAYLRHVWTGRFRPGAGGEAGQRVVPSGSLEVIVHLGAPRCALPAGGTWRRTPAATLIGLQRAPYEVRFAEPVEVFALCFRPAGFHTLFGVPVGEVAGGHDDAEAVLGRPLGRLAERLREAPDTPARLAEAYAWLRGAAGRRVRVAPYLASAERLIWASGGTARVDGVAAQLAVGRRQLERAFRDALGLSPKQYLRVARVNRALAWLDGGHYASLAEVAYRAGYADQAHFTREFTQIVGEAPTRYLGRPDAYAINALDVSAAARDADEDAAAGEDVAFVQAGAGAGGLG